MVHLEEELYLDIPEQRVSFLEASAGCAGVALVSMDSTGKKELGAFEL